MSTNIASKQFFHCSATFDLPFLDFSSFSCKLQDLKASSLESEGVWKVISISEPHKNFEIMERKNTIQIVYHKD